MSGKVSIAHRPGFTWPRRDSSCRRGRCPGEPSTGSPRRYSPCIHRRRVRPGARTNRQGADGGATAIDGTAHGGRRPSPRPLRTRPERNTLLEVPVCSIRDVLGIATELLVCAGRGHFLNKRVLCTSWNRPLSFSRSLTLLIGASVLTFCADATHTTEPGNGRRGMLRPSSCFDARRAP